MRYYPNYNLLAADLLLEGAPVGVFFEIGGVVWNAVIDGVPKTVVASLMWAHDKGLTPPVWVEFEKPRSVHKTLREVRDNLRVVQHAEVEAYILLLEADVRKLLVRFTHEEKDGKEVLYTRSWSVEEL